MIANLFWSCLPSGLSMGRGESETTPLVLESGNMSSTSNQAGTESPTEASGAAASFGVQRLVTIGIGAAASFTYIMLSAGMILFNKFLMRDNVFPFPVFLTSLHMCCSLVLALSLHRLCPSLFPAYSRVFAKWSGELEDAPSGDYKVQFMRLSSAFLPFAPIAACGAVCLVAGNSAYRYASVSFLQMVKETHIMFVYVLMILVGLDKFKFRMAAVITFVAGSAMLAVYGEIYFSLLGLMLQLASGLSGSGQIVLNNLLMSRSGSGKIDPLTLVLCTAPLMLLALIPANVFFWDYRIPALLHSWLPYIAFNAVLAFGLQISAATLIWITSGTGYALVCVAKDLAIVAAAQVFLHESFTALQVLGFAGAITGMMLYFGMKLFPEVFEPASEDTCTRQ